MLSLLRWFYHLLPLNLPFQTNSKPRSSKFNIFSVPENRKSWLVVVLTSNLFHPSLMSPIHTKCSENEIPLRSTHPNISIGFYTWTHS